MSKTKNKKIENHDGICHLAVNNSPDFIHLVDKDFKIVLFNDSFLKYTRSLGIKGDPEGKKLFSFFKFLKPKVKKEYEKVFKTKKQLKTHEETVLKNKKIYTETLKIPILNSKKEIDYVLTIVRDVTIENEARQELEEAQIYYEDIFNNVTVGILGVDIKTRKPLFANEYMKELTGYSEKDLLSMKVDSLHPKESLKEMVRELQSQAGGGSSKVLAFPVLKKNKEIIYCDIKSINKKIGGKDIVLVIFTDATDRKTAEEELTKSEKKFRYIFDNSNDVIVNVDLSGIMTDINKAFDDLTGYKREEYMGSSVFNLPFLEKKSAELIARNMQKLVKSKKIEPYNVEIITKKGEKKIFQIGSSKIFQDDKLIGFQSTIRDVSEKAEFEKNIAESEEMFRQLFDNIPSGIAIYKADKDCNKFYFKDLNKKAQEIEKVKKEKLLSKEVNEVFPGAKDMGIVKVFKNVCKTGKPVIAKESRYVDSKMGKTSYRDNFTFQLPNGDVVAVYDDVTDRVMAKEELKQKIDELERLNKIMVGRELRMIELKKEIQELKKKTK